MTTLGAYILDEHGNPQPCDDLDTWAAWLQTHNAERQIGDDRDEGPNGHAIRISTIFLGLDQRLLPDIEGGHPILWETRVFGGLLHGQMARYTSRASAAAGHQVMCQRVTATLEHPEARS
jgi:hypothetical protein